MQIVIDIDENVFTRLFDNGIEDYAIVNDDLFAIAKSIRKCTPLPEHHGRLGDLDSIMNDISNSINEMTNIGISIDGQYLWAKLNDAIDNAPTIIEGSEKRTCANCLLDGTDACSRGAGRAVDDSVCEDFI